MSSDRDLDLLLGRFMDVFVERLVDGLLERVDERLEQLTAEGADGAALDVKAAATRLGISPRGVARLVSSGRLPSLRVGRRRLIPIQGLTRLLAEGGLAEPIASPEP